MHSIAFLFFLAVLTGASGALWRTVKEDWSRIRAAFGIRSVEPSRPLSLRTA